MLLGGGVVVQAVLSDTERQQHLDIVGCQLQRLFELDDRVLVQATVEVELAEVTQQSDVAGIGFELSLELSLLGLVEDRELGGIAGHRSDRGAGGGGGVRRGRPAHLLDDDHHCRSQQGDQDEVDPADAARALRLLLRRGARLGDGWLVIAELGERLQPDDVVVGRLGWGWAGRRGLLAVEARHLRAGPTLQLGRRRREELPEFSCVGAFEVAVVGLVVVQCHVLC